MRSTTTNVRLPFSYPCSIIDADLRTLLPAVGVYSGGVADFQEGWAVVAAAIKQHAPAVKMYFTPNVAGMDQYDAYFPADASTVHVIGM